MAFSLSITITRHVSHLVSLSLSPRNGPNGVPGYDGSLGYGRGAAGAHGNGHGGYDDGHGGRLLRVSRGRGGGVSHAGFLSLTYVALMLSICWACMGNWYYENDCMNADNKLL